jgi:hypothetical protein
MDSRQNGYEAERLNILKMVEDGKISAGEAASLLSALSKETRSPLRSRRSTPKRLQRPKP